MEKIVKRKNSLKERNY